MSSPWDFSPIANVTYELRVLCQSRGIEKDPIPDTQVQNHSYYVCEDLLFGPKWRFFTLGSFTGGARPVNVVPHNWHFQREQMNLPSASKVFTSPVSPAKTPSLEGLSSSTIALLLKRHRGYFGASGLLKLFVLFRLRTDVHSTVT